MGGTTNTTSNTSTSTPTNPDVNATTSLLAQKLGGLANQSPAAFGSSLYSPSGATTQQGQSMALGAANNSDFTGSVNGAIKSFGNTAAGNDFGMNDPGYATLRQNAIDDAIKNVGAGFVNSGRFGGGSYTDQATKSAFDAASGLDYTNYQNDIQRQQQAAQILPSLYQAGQLPASIYGSVGAAQDANQQGILQGNADLYTRQQQAPLNWLQGVTSAAAGNASGAGTTTTGTQTTPATPWWQTAGSLALGGASLFL